MLALQTQSKPPQPQPRPLRLDCFEIPRLRHVPRLSHGDATTCNALIQGENLAVLGALLPRFQGAVRCCYIDPPYNNQEKHLHYEDAMDHQTWLSEVVARIELIAQLLRADGSLWISIDDREAHYLKVACDSILGRHNYVTTVVWQQRTTRENRKVFSSNHEYVLVYAKDIQAFAKSRNTLDFGPSVLARYKNPDSDSRGPWQSVSAHAQAGHGTPSQFYKIVSPSGKVHEPPPGRCWIYSFSKMKEEIAAGNVWFGVRGSGVPRIKKFLSNSKKGLTPQTLWTAAEVGTNDFAKKQLIKLFPDEELFDTPKPETLVHRIIQIATSEGDLVLDAYLGSGTTTAVAHKCGRHYIGIENGAHAVTYCAKRMRLVVDGEGSGVSNLVRWHGGGGFNFFRF